MDKTEEVKPDESKLLTKKEMQAINNAQPSEAKYGDVFKAIAKAQVTKHMGFEQARVERIVKEVEEHFEKSKTNPADFLWLIALKKREGVK